ncbi:uncharacterized protein LOC132628879 [Lycium barbarum]|uniref:uncharacterized protein LOC132628879 n=1 Tax=Lycium barbarum TaxID=112863 RepID=UPI00293F4E25|nr:uncharacterized protein LOC132628879 [Lycium barbarum]
MNSALIWNIRSVNTQQAFERVVMLHRQKKFNFIALMEPFQHIRHIEMYKLWVGMKIAWHNINGKIWLFIEEGYQVELQLDTDQLLSMKLTCLDGGQEITISMIYASTDRATRMTLWNDLYHISCNINSPWLVGGDFNVIVDKCEKFGGLEVPFVEVEDFNQCINICQLSDLGFKGSMYTWWNGRSDEQCIFKRLDRCLANQGFQELYPNCEVEHLIKQESDHSPLLITCKEDSRAIKKSFRFLNFWTEHPSFLDVVRNNWTGKLKKLGKVLSKWSRDTFGDIFRQIATLEEVVKVYEQEFEESPTSANGERLQKGQADLIRFNAIEEQFWKQKSGMQWFMDGDTNTKFFHAHVQGKRKKLQITRIQNQNKVWLDREEDISREAINFFQNQFTAETEATDFCTSKAYSKNDNRRPKQRDS